MILIVLKNTVFEKMIISKIIYNLPPNFNSIIAPWLNVPKHEHTIDHLKERLLQYESLL